MFRPQSLLRAAAPASRTAARPVALSQRWATTHAPTTSSAPANEISPEVQSQPGEEIDPQLNGYPQLPYVSLQTREPFGWWDRQERKNFGEVFHEEEDVLGMWGPDVHKISGGTAVLSLIAAFSAVGAFAYFLTATRIQRPVAAREYPYGGLEKELGGHVAARPEWEGDAE
ncbi:uncharacterized protein MKK02DRAFT_40087 [Dioszegia hungarica]|uniref:Uncharacterized protein n=1 Tax=Dioszegia hungarica TaxID=4972 RepID=A0AA38LXI3_9TREE|nr:uncharacterized protein MKK02DRAFT_40087 [Dioszegia hungarica]KAI9639762.1 hypothetical protein MKK02DRAFT_40087 [Dioszegia hungarica]